MPIAQAYPSTSKNSFQYDLHSTAAVVWTVSLIELVGFIRATNLLDIKTHYKPAVNFVIQSLAT